MDEDKKLRITMGIIVALALASGVWVGLAIQASNFPIVTTTLFMIGLAWAFSPLWRD